MFVLPVWGTLRGAGEEKVGRCLEGVLVEGVGVAMTVVESAGLDLALYVWDDATLHVLDDATL
jgi:hypothetical protein